MHVEGEIILYKREEMTTYWMFGHSGGGPYADQDLKVERKSSTQQAGGEL
jgi:hypothetical protein